MAAVSEWLDLVLWDLEGYVLGGLLACRTQHSLSGGLRGLLTV